MNEYIELLKLLSGESSRTIESDSHLIGDGLLTIQWVKGTAGKRGYFNLRAFGEDGAITCNEPYLTPDCDLLPLTKDWAERLYNR